MTVSTATGRMSERRFAGAAKFGLTAGPAAATYVESLVVVGVCAIIVYFMNRDAFTGFFYGEDFNTTNLYIAAHYKFFKAIFTPLIIFFRPTAYAWIVVTQGLLPWDPVVHHWRNFLVLILCLWLLHRLMLRLTDSRTARLIGISLITFSKVNLMMIGLINCIEVLGTVVYPLSTFLFLMRYFQSEKPADYLIALMFFILCAFSRDSNVLFFGVVVLAFAANAWEARGTTQLLKNGIRLLPFAAATVAYACVRYWLLGFPQVGGGTPYALNFGALHIATGLYYFAGTLVNVPFDMSDVAGTGDLSTLLNMSPLLQNVYHAVLVTAVILSFAVILISAVQRDLGCLVPLIWAGALLFPTLLIGNRQNYYAFEPVIALSLFLAMALDHISAFPWLRFGLFPFLLGLIGVNGYVSDQNIGVYAFRWVADREALLNEQIYKKHFGEPVKGLTIVVNDASAASLYQYLVQPISMTPGRVPLLNVFMSPTVETYQAVPFKDFSLEDVEKKKGQLVYRMNSIDETYTDITKRTVEVASVDADSAINQANGASRAIGDGGAESSWISAAQPGPHRLTVRLAGPTPLGSVRIVNPKQYRIAAMELKVLSKGAWISVFNEKDLENRQVIDARWPDIQTSAIEIDVKSSLHDGVPSPSAAIGKIEFPENRKIGEMPHAP